MRGTAVTAALLAVLAVVGLSPYVIEGPGPAINTLGEVDGRTIMKVSGRTTYPSASTLDLTTVSASGGPGRFVTGFETIGAWMNPHLDIVPKEYMYPAGVTVKEQDAQSAVEMTDSQQSAVAAALTELGIDFGRTTEVAGLATKANDAVLKTGDVVTSLDGEPVTDVNSLKSAVQDSTGDTVRLGLLRKGARSAVTARVAVVAGQRSLGIFVATRYDFPFEVTFGIENIGGPSAGTMMALGLIDQLTPGNLAGSLHVAGTGTVTEDGQVGAIGGIPQKVVGARRAGATVFLAPSANCAELRGRVPRGMDVYSVSTLHQARTVLTALGKGKDASAFPRCG